MLFPDIVMKWQADSWKRVQNATTGTTFLLNTNRLSDIRELPNHDCSLYYFDNPFDYRDNGHYMVINSTLAMLIGNMDYAPGTATLTLHAYTKNDPTLATADVTIPIAYFAYAYADINNATRSWVHYCEAGFNIKRILVNNTLGNMLFQVL